MSKERFEWIYNEKVLKHYIFDNLEHKQLAYKDIIYLLNKQNQQIDQLKQQLAEKDTRIEELEGQFAYECECNKQLVELQKQLAEKDKEIKKLNWQLKDKDFIIKNLNHSLSVAPNANAGQRARIDELTKIVKEKDKEIEWLKEQDGEYHNALAIQELEKVKKELIAKLHLLDSSKFGYLRHFVAWHDICDQINKQIKELKGEKK